LVYLLSFIIFAMRENGAWYVTPFGLRGLRAFLMAAPWVLILVALAILAILEVLVRRFSFAYRRPLLYSVLGVLALVTLSSFAVARTPLHASLMRDADRRQLPIGGGFYRGYGHDDAEDVYPGFVTRLIGEGFELAADDGDGDGLPVLIAPSTKFVPEGGVEIGDRVIVFGPLAEGRIHAFGVRILPPSAFDAR
ncbi:MAG TPA: hypothetical protein VJ694_03370, partial [Patescibacteria group bacterium]|nr:hypothetical protein [Patescibacteria group bacterium]